MVEINCAYLLLTFISPFCPLRLPQMFFFFYKEAHGQETDWCMTKTENTKSLNKHLQ